MEIHTALFRYIKGTVTKEDEKRILLWLKEDKEHVHQYKSLRKLYDLETWNADQSNIRHSNKKKYFSFRHIAFELFKIASILLIGVLITYSYLHKEKITEQLQTIHVPSGQRTELILNDGTKVWLNSGTTVTFPSQFSNDTREITLNGEAYLQVARNDKKPFIVNTEHFKIRVLGTEFNVIAYKGKGFMETALLEGSVEVIPDNGDDSFLLNKNETVAYSNGKFLKSTINDINYFKWREGLICFEKENLSSLFAKLELYYDIRIINKNVLLTQGSYTGKFRIRDGIEHVLRVLQLKHAFKYSKDDETNVITIE